MKKSHPLLYAFLFCFLFSNAQNIPADENFQNCAQEQVLTQLLNSDPHALARHLAMENRIYQATQSGLTVQGSRATVLYTLPVVVHIIHNNGSENISDAL